MPNKVVLPLLKDLMQLENKLFDDSSEIKVNELLGYTIPSYINENMIHTLRYYQENALRFFHYTRVLNNFSNTKHVLFNMATGSGKTDLMAALILYLFEKHGYTNFLFIVNSNAVLNKTVDNLTNSSSKKYLYKNEILINGERITIKKVSVFPSVPAANTIYIKLDTVQAVVNDLYIPKQNTMDKEDYKKNKTVILGDEAHHYSATTKSEKEDERSWEVAINEVLNAHENNLLLEFTATIDLENRKVYEKYKEKIVYKYSLNEFMTHGYSKNVMRIESSEDDREKMLSVILLSQYRKYYAEKNGVSQNFKPVIFFKASRVAISNWAEKEFNNLVENLTVEELLDFISERIKTVSQESETLQMAFAYFMDHIEDLGRILLDIQQDFQPRNIINANDSDRGAAMLEKGQYKALNSLDQPDNFYRVVFAVGKLTEGWDVLNLYDIVRISENAKSDKKSTISEAQLIGRGARYYPFELNGEVSFKRRFEKETPENLLLETLHYHTINEPQYLKNLVTSLKEMDFPTGSDAPSPKLEIELKKEFKLTETWKNGKIYYNKKVTVDDSFYSSLSKYGIDNTKEITIRLLNSSKETIYNELAEKNNKVTNLITWKDENERERFFRKAINKNNFFRFDRLKNYLPKLESINDFILKEEWLNIRNLNLRVETEDEITLTPKTKLQVVTRYLHNISEKIKFGYQRERGTNEFIGYPIRDYITNYRKALPKIDTLHSSNITQIVEPRDMTGQQYTWYPYNKAIINGLEYKLIERIKERIPKLAQDGREVFLIRMDEQMNRETKKGDQLKLHQFDKSLGENSNINFAGFQPDFILSILDADYFYQIFIEPKDGSTDRMHTEQWKEDLLIYISENNVELVFEDEIDNVIIRGLKFFTDKDTRNSMEKLDEMFNLTNLSIIN